MKHILWVDGLRHQFLEAIGTHIFFDDQDSHLSDSKTKVPCGKVLYKTNSILKNYEKEIIVESKKEKRNNNANT